MKFTSQVDDREGTEERELPAENVEEEVPHISESIYQGISSQDDDEDWNEDGELSAEPIQDEVVK